MPCGLVLVVTGGSYISRVVSDGQADNQGLQVGDAVRCVGQQQVRDYSELMQLLPLLPRPMAMTVARSVVNYVAAGSPPSGAMVRRHSSDALNNMCDEIGAALATAYSIVVGLQN